MKNLITKIVVFSLVLSGMVSPLFSATDEPRKATVAVAKIEVFPALKAKIERENRDESMKRIVESITDNMGAAIQATRRLEVVTINDLDVIVKAIERGENVLASEEFSAALKNFEYAFAIKIDDYQDFEQKKEFPALGQTLTYRKIRLGAIANFIESKSASVAEAPNIIVNKTIKTNANADVSSVGGDKTDEIIAQLAREFCRKVAFKLADFISPPRVLSVSKNGKTVTINKGEDTDIFKGEVYEIFALGEELVDPDTGEVLGAEEEYVGKVKVTRITAKFSQAKVLEDEGIEKGCVARPLEENAE